MEYLFIFSIGPVQDFIATARRSRDLWYGSWMLSELSKAVARSLGKENLIFPSNTADINAGSPLSLSNKIEALIECETPQEIGQKAKEAARNRLRELRDNAFNAVRGDLETKKLAEAQVEDLLEFYWSAVPLKNAKEYEATRSKAEALLSARKATRNFEQREGNHKPKSSLDGKRESVIPESEYPDYKKDNHKEVERKAKNLYRRYGAHPGERLSGVDLMKRLGKPAGKKPFEPSFHSTSHYASLPFQEMLRRELSSGEDKAILQEICDAYGDWVSFGDIPKHDGSLLYESRTSDYLPAGEEQEKLKKEIGKIYQKHSINERPSPYYALLRADGDDMGKIIDNQASLERHRKLSETLSKFAGEVSPIVEKYMGEVIYAGGDDILAYLPLHTVLNCVSELDAHFQKRMKGFEAKDGKKPSLSAGIVIAHHLTPLSDVMEISRNAERLAKEVDGKNGLAIIASKRSGEDRVVSDQQEILYKRLKRMVEFHREKAISKGTAYELQEINKVLAGINDAALQDEALRIIKRKRESGKEKPISQEVLVEFETWITKNKIPLDKLMKEMIVASLFASSLEMAEGKKENNKEDK